MAWHLSLSQRCDNNAINKLPAVLDRKLKANGVRVSESRSLSRSQLLSFLNL